MRFIFYIAIVLAAGVTRADLIMDGATTAWTIISYGTNIPDNVNDEQTGVKESEMVGDAQHPSLYYQFDPGDDTLNTDGWLAFRFRLAENQGGSDFDRCAFVGIDADLDGDIDLFIGVHNSGSADEIAVWNPGAGLNISPNTTSLESPPIMSYAETSTNYSWMAVTSANDPTATDFDLDDGHGGGDHTDRFLSFAVPMQDIVYYLGLNGINITESTPLAYIAATATQDNSLNQDLNGITGGVGSSSTWSELGGVTDPVSPDGTVPEPATAALCLLAAVGLWPGLRRAAASR